MNRFTLIEVKKLTSILFFLARALKEWYDIIIGDLIVRSANMHVIDIG